MPPAPWTVTRISLFARGLRDLREKRTDGLTICALNYCFIGRLRKSSMIQ